MILDMQAAQNAISSHLVTLSKLSQGVRVRLWWFAHFGPFGTLHCTAAAASVCGISIEWTVG